MHTASLESSRRRARGVATSFLIALGLLVMALAANAIVSSHATAATERVTLSGADVAIFNLAGKARLEAGSGTSVQVTVTTLGRDADQLEIETRDLSGRRTLVVSYPGNRVIYPEMGRGSRTEVRVRENGTFDGDWGRDWAGGWDRVRISGTGTGLEAYADLEVSIPRGQKLALYLAAGNVTVANVDGTLRVDTGAGSVSTNDTKGELVVDTGSGAVNVGGATGPVDVDTGSGEVNVARVRGDILNVDTGSGSVHARDISVAKLSCDTGSGEVEVSGITAREISIDTGSGSVEVTLDAPCEEILVDTGSGDVTVNVPRGFGADISFESGSGDFDSELPVTVREREHGSFRGRVGSGAARVVVETGSGDMRLAENAGSSRSRR